MNLEVNQVHCGDATALLRLVERDSVALSIWSPPYFVGKEYEKHLTYETWLQLLRKTIHLHFDLLKPGGFMVVNMADILCFPDENIPRFQAENISRRRCDVTREMVLEAKARHPTLNRDELARLLGCSEQTIDRRLNGNNIRGGKYATQTRVHLVGGLLENYAYEASLFLYDRRVWVKDAAWENSRWTSISYRAVDEFEYLFFFWKPGATLVDKSRLAPQEWVEWGSRAVWQIPSVRANDNHEAKYPIELPRRAIRLLTEAGDLVIDPFMGSGTTALAAIETGRNYIGMELQPHYAEMANRACARARQQRDWLQENAAQSTTKNSSDGLFEHQLTLAALDD